MGVCLVVCSCGQYTGLCVFGAFRKVAVYWPLRVKGLKSFITKVLEYKAGLNRRIKFACVAMCSLVMSLCSRDLLVTSLRAITIH